MSSAFIFLFLFCQARPSFLLCHFSISVTFFLTSVPFFLQTLCHSPSAHLAFPWGCFSFLVMCSSLKWSAVHTFSFLSLVLVPLAELPFPLLASDLSFLSGSLLVNCSPPLKHKYLTFLLHRLSLLRYHSQELREHSAFYMPTWT